MIEYTIITLNTLNASLSGGQIEYFCSIFSFCVFDDFELKSLDSCNSSASSNISLDNS